MTPEGRIKAQVDTLLKAFAAYKHKPVSNGMGAPALDYHVCCGGVYAAIETKAPGKWPTARQTLTMREVIAAKGAVFLIQDSNDLQELKAWLNIPVRAFTSTKTTAWLAKLNSLSSSSEESSQGS